MKKIFTGKRTAILVMILMMSSSFSALLMGNVHSETMGYMTVTLYSTIVYHDISTNSIRIETESPSYLSVDIEANAVFLSSQPGDVNKEHVVTAPQAGQNVYIHWVFSIIGSGTVNPFDCRIWLHTESGYDVIDTTVAVDNPQPGYIYTYWFNNPWTAPGGNYILSEYLDIYNAVIEDDENNNDVSLSFSVSPTNLNFDFEAKDTWLSSEPNDWDKDHQLYSPLNSGTEVFFYFHWIIEGVPETVTNSYYFKITLTGPNGFEFEEIIDEIEYRRAGYNIKVFLHDENGNGWIASPGDYSLSCIVDSQNNVDEWNENNNIISTQFVVENNILFYFLHLTDVHIDSEKTSQEVWGNILEQINEMNPPPAFVVVTGDLLDFGRSLSYNYIIDPFNGLGDKPKLVGSKITTISGGWVIIPSNIPIYFCPGNHDSYDGTYVPGAFGFYENNIADSYYHKSLPPIYGHTIDIFSLNSGTGWNYPGLSHQGDGLKDEYGMEVTNFPIDISASTADIKVVLTHHPCNDGTSNHENEFTEFNDEFRNICNQNDVDLLCCGHTHKGEIREISGERLGGPNDEYIFTPHSNLHVQIIGDNLWKSYIRFEDNFNPGQYRKIGVLSNGDIKIFSQTTFASLSDFDIINNKLVNKQFIQQLFSQTIQNKFEQAWIYQQSREYL